MTHPPWGNSAHDAGHGWLLVVGWICLAGISCDETQFSKPLILGGQEVPAAVLNRGLTAYRHYCVGCHGMKGDGQAPSAASMNPPPRDFTRGIFKFRSVPRDTLPSDEDLLHTLRYGLKGTHMPGWGTLPGEEASSLIQYIKTFSPRWREETPGKAIPMPQDPWGQGQRNVAVTRGEAVYHALSQCWACHPAYATKQQILEMTRAEMIRAGKTPPGSIPWRDRLDRSREVACAFGKVKPPDFLADTLRASRDKTTLYQVIAAGIGGTPMPSWYQELSAQDLWAVVHYVQELVRLAGTPQAEQLRRRAQQP
jgi:mono/diheme cytochrome c family protein